MSKNWNTYKLQNITSRIGSGATPRGGKESYLPSGEISLIRSQNVLDFSFSNDGLAFISSNQADKLNNVKVEEEDILLNITGDSVARVCMVPDSVIPARVNQHVAIVRAQKDKVNPYFLKYYMLQPAFKGYMLGLAAAGATRKALTKGMIENFEINLPNLSTQNEIAQVLSSLDNKIELNLQMNETLEKMAQTIFYERFGKFKPGDDLPEGWKWTQFSDELEVVRGLSYKGAGLTDFESGVPMHNLNSVFEGGGYKRQGIKFYKGDYKDKHQIEPWDVIVANTEQGHKYLLIGYPAWVPQKIGQMGIFSHHLYRVRPLESSYLTSQFIYRLIMLRAVREQIIGAANGTTVNMLKMDGLQLPLFPLPRKEEVNEFSDMCKNLWMRQEVLYDENESLIATRDSLLPRLMSGKIELN